MKDIQAMTYERLKSYALTRMGRDTKFGLCLLSQVIYEIGQFTNHTSQQTLIRLIVLADEKASEKPKST